MHHRGIDFPASPCSHHTPSIVPVAPNDQQEPHMPCARGGANIYEGVGEGAGCLYLQRTSMQEPHMPCAEVGRIYEGEGAGAAEGQALRKSGVDVVPSMLAAIQAIPYCAASACSIDEGGEGGHRGPPCTWSFTPGSAPVPRQSTSLGSSPLVMWRLNLAMGL